MPNLENAKGTTNMSSIVKCVEASLRMDAMNGDMWERNIFANQVRELVDEFKRLEEKLKIKLDNSESHVIL